jgi:hypothetical protein
LPIKTPRTSRGVFMRRNLRLVARRSLQLTSGKPVG